MTAATAKLRTSKPANRIRKQADTQQDLPRAEQRRLQVIEAASRCFSQHGFHGASMAQVATAAGMSVGHIYHYFTNKNEIIAAIVAHHVQHIRAEINSFLLEPSTVEAMINNVDRPLQRAMDTGTTALFMEILAESYRNPEIKRIMQDAEREIHKDRLEVLSKALPHETDTTLINAKAELITALFHGLCMRAVVKPHLDHAPMPALLSDVMRHVLK
ncbi:MAG: TetR family transcriptional regulator [Steroidobacteraceae bacterium]